jgi:hypothetical protein
MKRAVRALAKLYPPLWRERYGREFDELLGATDLKWWDVIDVLRGALAMRIRGLGLVTVGLAIAGAVIAGLASLTVPKTYSSVATLHLQSPERPGGCEAMGFKGFQEAEVRNAGTDSARRLVADSLSQNWLAAIIQQENLHKFSVSSLRRSTRVEFLASDAHANDTAIRITFADQDSARARRVETDMIARLMEVNLAAAFSGRGGVLCFSGPTSLSTIKPNRLLMTATGCGIGLVLGAMAQWLLRVRFGTA